MRSFLERYAKYNKETNIEIIRLLSGLSEHDLYCEQKMYYKSISNLFNHLVMAEWHYLNAVKSIAKISHPLEQERQELFIRIENSFLNASTILKVLDEELIDVINNLSEEQLNLERKKSRIYNGRLVDITIWEFMSQHIIHQTHHRGQISQVLDEIGVDNDFGNMFPYVKDSVID